MRYIWRKKQLLTLLLIASVVLSAQASSSDKSTPEKEKTEEKEKKELKVSTEFGLGVGARYNLFSVHPISQNFTAKIDMRLSYGTALQFRVNIGRHFGIQPEISYAYSNLNIEDKDKGLDKVKIQYSIVQVPLLLSFKVAMFRFNAGPVFTLTDSPTYFLENSEGVLQQQFIGRLNPTVTYTAGVSAKLGRRTIVDLRYADQFTATKSENNYFWTTDQSKQPEAQEFRTSCRSVQLRVGVVF